MVELPERRIYQEYHYQKVEDVGVAFDEKRIWVCLNGGSTLRAKVMSDGQLLVEFYPPDEKLEGGQTR